LALSPHANNYAAVSRALAAKGDASSALKAAESGLRLDPRNEQCLSARSTALLGLRRPEASKAALHDALRVDPDSSALHTNLAVAHFHSGNLDRAAAHYHEALRLDPTNSAAQSGLRHASRRGSSAATGRVQRAMWAWTHLSPGVQLPVVGAAVVASVFWVGFLMLAGVLLAGVATSLGERGTRQPDPLVRHAGAALRPLGAILMAASVFGVAVLVLVASFLQDIETVIDLAAGIEIVAFVVVAVSEPYGWLRPTGWVCAVLATALGLAAHAATPFHIPMLLGVFALFVLALFFFALPGPEPEEPAVNAGW
jgi:tetratricopeptide (TPR) repeat protein